MNASKEALEFMKENRYRNCQDRSCANCSHMFFLNGKMTCTGGGNPSAHFTVYQFATCDAWDRRKTFF